MTTATGAERTSAVSTARNVRVPLDQTRAPVDYEGGAYDPGTCPECGSDDPRRTADWMRVEGVACTHRFHDVCDRPGEGWYCTRPRHHDGPCAAHPDFGSLPLHQKVWDAMVSVFGRRLAILLLVVQAILIGQFALLGYLIFA
jgi:hypothetical protein